MQIRTRVSHLQSDGRAERQRYIEGKKRRTLSLEATLFRGVKSNAFGPQYFGLSMPRMPRCALMLVATRSAET